MSTSLLAEWPAPTPFRSVSDTQRILAALAACLVLALGGCQTSSKQPLDDVKLKLALSTCALCVMGFLTLLLGLLFSPNALFPTDKVGFGLTLCDTMFDVFNSIALALLQISCVALVRGSTSQEALPKRAQIDKGKVLRSMTVWTQYLAVIPLSLILTGHDGSVADGTYRLGLGRRISTVLQAVAQVMLLVLLVDAKTTPSAPSSRPLARRLRDLYLHQAGRALVLVTFCLVSLLARAFPVNNQLSKCLQAPLLIFWVEMPILLVLDSTLRRQLEIEEEEARDDAVLRLGGEESGVDETKQDEDNLEGLIGGGST